MWLSDMDLNTGDKTIRNKVQEGLVYVSSIEIGRPLVLKLILKYVINIDNSTKNSLTQSLQTIRMKVVAGENVGTIISYLKGSIMLLQHFSEHPTNMIGLLNTIMCSADF